MHPTMADGGSVVKAVLTLKNLAAAAGVFFAAYVLITSLPDLRRYIRISTM